MTKLPSSNKVIKILSVHGFYFKSSKGSHHKYTNGTKVVIVPAPRKEIPVNPVDYPASIDKDLIRAELIEAEGGLAIRLGNDLILWRNYDDWKVEADGIISTRRMELRKDHFK